MSEELVRPPVVAGTFYPDDAGQLRATLQACLAAAHPPDWAPRAVVAPHAGYIYSGRTAGVAWAAAARRADAVERVVLLGPSHRVPLLGLATSPASHWETPLGRIALDQDGARALLALPQVHEMAAAHAHEHSLEVEVPFIQTVLPKARLLPLVVGEAAPGEVAEVLREFWDDETSLIAISSDLSHYHDYDTARSLDQATAGAIEHCRIAEVGPEQACGCRALAGLLQLADESGCRVETLDLCNSGDSAGDRERVVGYGAFAVH